MQVQVGETSVTELVYDDDMKGTPKGFGIIETHQINDVDKFRAVILCKVTPSIPANSATTKGESIDWQTKEVEMRDQPVGMKRARTINIRGSGKHGLIPMRPQRSI